MRGQLSLRLVGAYAAGPLALSLLFPAWTARVKGSLGEYILPALPRFVAIVAVALALALCVPVGLVVTAVIGGWVRELRRMAQKYPSAEASPPGQGHGEAEIDGSQGPLEGAGLGRMEVYVPSTETKPVGAIKVWGFDLSDLTDADRVALEAAVAEQVAQQLPETMGRSISIQLATGCVVAAAQAISVRRDRDRERYRIGQAGFAADLEAEQVLGLLPPHLRPRLTAHQTLLPVSSFPFNPFGSLLPLDPLQDGVVSVSTFACPTTLRVRLRVAWPEGMSDNDRHPSHWRPAAMLASDRTPAELPATLTWESEPESSGNSEPIISITLRLTPAPSTLGDCLRIMLVRTGPRTPIGTNDMPFPSGAPPPSAPQPIPIIGGLLIPIIPAFVHKNLEASAQGSLSPILQDLSALIWTHVRNQTQQTPNGKAHKGPPWIRSVSRRLSAWLSCRGRHAAAAFVIGARQGGRTMVRPGPSVAASGPTGISGLAVGCSAVRPTAPRAAAVASQTVCQSAPRCAAAPRARASASAVAGSALT